MLLIYGVEPWQRAAKRVRADGSIEPYLLGARFRGVETGWTSAREAFAALELLRREPRACLLRGTLIDPAAQPFRRRTRHEGRAIRPCARRLLAIDLDDLGPVDGMDALAAAALDRLPDDLRAGPIRIHATASCSHSNGRARVYVWLDHPASDRTVRAALRGWSDPSLASPVQPHYTADAVRDGADPWPDRVREYDLPGVASLGASDDLATQALERLEAARGRTARAKAGDRHRVLNREAYHVGTYVGGGHLERERAIESLMSAAMGAGLDAERARDEVSRAVDDGALHPIAGEAWRAGLLVGQDGAPRACEANAIHVLRHDPEWSERIAWDTMSRQPVWLDPPPWAGEGPIERAHATLVADDVARRHRMVVGGATMLTAIEAVATEAPYDPLRAWLDEQPWDGVHRVDTCLSSLLGADDSPYTRGAARALLLGLAGRILRPGCQHDLTVVLLGGQGGGKTTFLRMLGGPWYVEVQDIQSEEAIYQCSRGALVELGEIHALSTADRARYRAWLTRTEDTYRPKYERAAITVPRRFVTVGTTNERGFLRDSDGERRILPVRVRTLDREECARVVGLLLGEARERVLAGETWHEVPDATAAQLRETSVDPWVEVLSHAARDRYTVREACIVLEIAPERTNGRTVQRIADALRAAGYIEIEGARPRAWGRARHG